MLTTGDTLAKPEHHVADPKALPTAPLSPVSSIIKHWPKAEIKEGEPQTDVQAARDKLLIAVVEHYLRTLVDAPLHASLRAQLAVVQNADAETGNEVMATGGMIPVLKGPTGTVDDDPLPLTSAKTTDPTIQPPDSKIPGAKESLEAEKKEKEDKPSHIVIAKE